GGILANRVDGHGINIVFRFIGDYDPWRLAQDGFDICRGEFFLRLDVDGLRVAAKNRNTNSGRSDAQRGLAENFAGLVDHLQLFFGVTSIHKGVDVWNTIEGNLLWKLLHLKFLPVIKGGDLLAEFLHRLAAGPGHRLISRHHDPPDARGIVNRLKRHDHLNGRTIGIGNDAAIFVLGNLLRVDFGHHQRDVGLHAKKSRIIHDYRAGIHRNRSELDTYTSPSREKPDIDPFE